MLQGRVDFEYAVWVLNQLEEGYKFDDARRVPVGCVDNVVIWENMGVLFPAVRLVLSDPAGVIMDMRHKGGAVVKFYTKGKEDFFDFALVTHNVDGMENLRRPSTQYLVLNGFDAIGAWLSKAKSRGFGKKSASQVARSVVEEELKEYLRLGNGVKLTLNVVNSVDREWYVQSGGSSSMFLYYLRDKAEVAGKRRDVCCWFDRRGKEIRFNFVSVKDLVDGRVKFKLRYTVDPKEVERALFNGGYIGQGELCMLSFKVISLSQVLGWVSGAGKVYEFDRSRLKVVMHEYNHLRQLGGRVKDSLWYRLLESGQDRFVRVQDVGYTVRNLFRRFLVAVILGCRDVRLGDKVRVIVPAGYEGAMMYESVSGDWIVVGIVHLISNRGRAYLMKLLLGSPTLKSEKKGAF